jgi:hypothetical protein
MPSPGIYVPNDLDQTMENLGEFMVNTLRQAELRGYHNIEYLILFTEPNNTFIYTSPVWHRDEPRSFELYAKAVRAIDKALRDEGIRNQYLLVGPNDNVDSSESYFVEQAVSELDDCLDIYGTHASYPKANFITQDMYAKNMLARYPNRFNLIQSTGKPLWIDEINVYTYTESLTEVQKSPWVGTQLGVMASTAMNFGVQNLFVWTVADQQWPNLRINTESFFDGIQAHGALRSLFKSSIPKPHYYSMSLLTKYTGAGTVYACTADKSGVYISCQQLDDGNWTVIITNTNSTTADFTVEFESGIGKNLYRHVYNPATVKPDAQANIIAADKTFSNVNLSFSDTLGAGCMAVYTSVAS